MRVAVAVACLPLRPRDSHDHEVIETVGACFHIEVGAFACDGVVLDEAPIGIQVEVVD
ncbi:MAG: hypothetical protein IPJ85_16955 [Flavobacteriales bacterium]|nr:hypothetical protein [Flavobacteriales bacterium]